MAGKRGGLAARPGRGRTEQSLTRDAEVGQKRKAPDVLLSARKAAKDNGASHASARPGLTMTALQSTFQQQAGSLEAQVQEQSMAELAGLTALETDLNRSAKASDSLSITSCNPGEVLLRCWHLSQKIQLHIHCFVQCQAEWGSDMKSLERNCGSCVAAVRSSTIMLARVQDVQDNFAQQLAQLLACNKVN
ncbi:TPA: hypothetical protein ACH3X3_000076 [Trebouxia sp. C0006]